MERTIVIRRYGSLIQLSPDGTSPLPRTVSNIITPHLLYDRHIYLHGADAHDPVTGDHRSMRVEKVKLFKMDGYSRLVTGFGFLDRLWGVLEQAGYQINYVDESPPRTRPGCYEPDWENLYRNFQLRPRQEDCLLAMAMAEGGYIEASVGFGKSELIAAHAMLYPRAKFAVTVPGGDNVRGLAATLRKYFSSVGVVGMGHHDRDKRIMVYSADSLNHFDGDADFFDADEVHRLLAESYANEIARRATMTRNFGFSATPTGRFDNAGKRLEHLFGRKLFEITYQDCVELGLVVPIRVLWTKVELSRNPIAGLKMKIPRFRHGIWRNDERNETIAQKVVEFNDYQTLILVQTIEHALHLHAFLPHFQLCYGSSESEKFNKFRDRGLVDDAFIPISAKQREEMRQRFKAGDLQHVIATDVWSTGVSFEGLHILGRADARSNTVVNTQGPGRTARLYDGKECGTILEFDDGWDPYFATLSKQRKRDYKRLGWTNIADPNGGLLDGDAHWLNRGSARRTRSGNAADCG